MTRKLLPILAFLMILCSGERLALAQDPFVAFQKQDYATALTGFQELAAQGNANAMNNLGLIRKRTGRDGGSGKAVDWYNQAAGMGHIGAINNLGGMYEMGQGVAQSYAKAAEKYALAAKYGLSDAQYNLAALYEAGKGLQNDPLQAYIWYSLAAAKGDKDAAVGRDRMAKVLDPTLRHQADQFAASWKPSK